MKKELIVLSVVIVLLAGILLLHKKNNVNYTIPELGTIKEQQVTKLVINSPDGEINLVKDGDTWETRPEGYKADEKKVSSLISQLAKLSISALVSEQQHYNIYDLSNDKRISVTAYAGDKVVRGLDIGKTAASGRQTYILLAGDKNVYQADGITRSTFDTSIDRLRDLTVLAFDDDISAITIETGTKKIKLNKKTSPPERKKDSQENPAPKQSQWESEDGKVASASAIDEAIKTMKNLTCEKYIDGKNKGQMGKPVYRITLKGSKDYSISVFDNAKDNRYPMISSESNYPFFLPEWKAKKIMPDEKMLFSAN